MNDELKDLVDHLADVRERLMDAVRAEEEHLQLALELHDNVIRLRAQTSAAVEALHRYVDQEPPTLSTDEA